MWHDLVSQLTDNLPLPKCSLWATSHYLENGVPFHWSWDTVSFFFLFLFLSFLHPCLLSGFLSPSLSQDAGPWHTERWLGSFTEHSVSVRWCQTPAEAWGISVITEISLLLLRTKGQCRWWGPRDAMRDPSVEAAGESCMVRAGGHMGTSGWGGRNRKKAPQKRECPSTPELRNLHNVGKHDTLIICLISS